MSGKYSRPAATAWPGADPSWSNRADWTGPQSSWLMHDWEPQTLPTQDWPENVLDILRRVHALPPSRIARHATGRGVIHGGLDDAGGGFSPQMVNVPYYDRATLIPLAEQLKLRPLFLYPPPTAPSVEAPFPLRLPGQCDDWCELIRDAVKEFHAEHGVWPTKAQTWARLCTKPPHSYEISSARDRGEDAIALGDRLLGRGAFAKRWKRYIGQ
jgi:hypothetical protein